jgi:hypothetical protein
LKSAQNARLQTFRPFVDTSQSTRWNNIEQGVAEAFPSELLVLNSERLIFAVSDPDHKSDGRLRTISAISG